MAFLHSTHRSSCFLFQPTLLKLVSAVVSTVKSPSLLVTCTFLLLSHTILFPYLTFDPFSSSPPSSPPADVSTQTFSAGGAAASGSPSSGASPASISHRFMTQAERLLAVGNSATFAVVANANGAIVGQLVGNGYSVGASVSLVYPLNVCITQSASIDQDTTSYPVFDFAIAKADGTVHLTVEQLPD